MSRLSTGTLAFTGLLGAAILAACSAPVASLHSLAEDDQIIFEPALLGEWTDSERTEVYRISRLPGARSYRLENPTDCELGTLRLSMTQIDGARYVIATQETPEGLVAPVHLFFRVDLTGDVLGFTFLEEEWLADFLGAHPEALAHTEIDDGLLLTASTTDLRGFHRQRQLIDEGWDEPDWLLRITTAEAEALVGVDGDCG